jgi:enolase
VHAYEHLGSILKTRRKNDENAWETNKANEEILKILQEIKKQYKVRIGIDMAASTFYSNGYYKYKNKELIRDKLDQADYITKLIKKYNLFYVEDPMNEEDFSGFIEIMNHLKKQKSKTLIVGDDITTTSLKRTRRATGSKAINAVIIKPNQIGSLVEVKHVVEFCKKNNLKIIFSHRSGETMDDTLADLAVGFQADFIKTGISGKERLIKLKRIMDIEKSI